jgi:hypothetical protein
MKYYYPIYYINWYYIFFTVSPPIIRISCSTEIVYHMIYYCPIMWFTIAQSRYVLLSGDIRATSTDFGTFRYVSLWRWLMLLWTYILWCDNFTIYFLFLVSNQDCKQQSKHYFSSIFRILVMLYLCHSKCKSGKHIQG